MPLAPRVPVPLRTPMLDADGIVDKAWAAFFQQQYRDNIQTAATVQYGTHSTRLATALADFPDGSLWSESDRNGITYQVRNGVWAYVSGTLELLQGQIGALVLGAADAGLLLRVIDFAHSLEWNGTGWQWASGDTGGGFIQSFLLDPNPTTGWALCDGASEITYLAPDASLSKTALPDLENRAAYLKYGNTGIGLISTPIAPKFQGDLYTPLGSVAQPRLFLNGVDHTSTTYTLPGTIDPVTPVGTVAVGASSGANSVPGGTSGTFFDCASVGHTHSATFSGTPVTPIYRNTPFTAVIPAPLFFGIGKAPTGLITPDGEPQNIVLRAWFRR